jgi:aryl sulfotransferase
MLYWLASYPKSGNTWLRLLLHSYLASGAAVDINNMALDGWSVNQRALFDEAIGVSASDLTDAEILTWWPWALREWARARTEPAYLKTHAHERSSDFTLGAIYLVRDPRDVAMSLARHLNCSVDAAIAVMGTQNQTMSRSRYRLQSHLVQCWGSWSQNVENWMAPAPFPIHVLPYEKIRADPVAALVELLPTLGLSVNHEAAKAAAKSTALETLRKQEASQGFAEAVGPHRFFGDGRIEGWREGLTHAQISRIEGDHGQVMARLGYIDRVTDCRLRSSE